MQSSYAPGAPGIEARWTSTDKFGIGTALSRESNVWFTFSHGIVNEVYYPRVDVANLRDMECLVTDGSEFFSEEKRHTHHEYHSPGVGIPAFHLVNSCIEGRYRLEKRIVVDPQRHVLLQEITFVPLRGSLSDYHFYLLVSPHIGNNGMHNTAWSGDYKGVPALFAQRDNIALACISSSPFIKMSCGFVGTSDPWHDLFANKQLTNCYECAEEGNVALVGEINLTACQGRFTVALGFGANRYESGFQARSALLNGMEVAWKEYVTQWEQYQRRFTDLSHVDREGGRLFAVSNSVLKIQEGKHLSGSAISSLSVPWGSSTGDSTLGGYHLIWPRDQVKRAFALLAAGDDEGARQTLLFLMSTQEADGHWSQSISEEGLSWWPGIQIDETALPILLADHLRRHKALGSLNPLSMVQSAATFIIRQGPVTQEDRWEEASGYAPFTLAVEIAALLAAADCLSEYGDLVAAEYLRETADWWNESIERWLYVTDTPLAQQSKVPGYYVRMCPSERLIDGIPSSPEITLPNLPEGENRAHYADIISTDFLALVRYGLRKADDLRILNSVKVIDILLKSETAKGSLWHRYNRDGYGEQFDGSPFLGSGIGRGWPLLSAERAHYEIARGDFARARELLQNIVGFGGKSGLLPEQVWDGPDIAEKGLYNGMAAGSAKPLVLAHAEYITLLRSISDGTPFDKPPQTQQRYLIDAVPALYGIWRLNHQLAELPSGKRLRIQADDPGFIRWTADNWESHTDTTSCSLCQLGIFYADIPLEQYPPSTIVEFTLFSDAKQQWNGKNYRVLIVER